MKYQHQNKRVVLFWIKAYIGLEDIERTDKLAKKVALKLKKDQHATDARLISFVKRTIRRETLDEWNKIYKESNTGHISKLFVPDITTAYSIIKTNKDTKITVI